MINDRDVLVKSTRSKHLVHAKVTPEALELLNMDTSPCFGSTTHSGTQTAQSKGNGLGRVEYMVQKEVIEKNAA